MAEESQRFRGRGGDAAFQYHGANVSEAYREPLRPAVCWQRAQGAKALRLAPSGEGHVCWKPP